MQINWRFFQILQFSNIFCNILLQPLYISESEHTQSRQTTSHSDDIIADEGDEAVTFLNVDSISYVREFGVLNLALVDNKCKEVAPYEPSEEQIINIQAEVLLGNACNETEVITVDEVRLPESKECDVESNHSDLTRLPHSLLNPGLEITDTQSLLSNENMNTHVHAETVDICKEIPNVSTGYRCRFEFPKFVDGRLRVEALFDERGGHITLPGLHVTLTIPPGAIRKGKQQLVYLMVSLDPAHQPRCADGESLIATPIICGPHGLQFERNVLLSHRIIPNKHGKYEPLISHNDDNDTPYNYSDVDENDHETCFFVIDNQAFWYISHFTGFTAKATGDSGQPIVLQIYPFMDILEDDGCAVLRIRYFQDLPGKHQVVYDLEQLQNKTLSRS